MLAKYLKAVFGAAIITCAPIASSWPQSQGEEADIWAEYPAREVERPSLPAGGGLVSTLLIRSIGTERAFDEDGKIEDTYGDYNLFTLDFRLSYGVTERVEVLGGVPYITGEIGVTSGGGLGDVYFGFRGCLVRESGFDLAIGLIMSAPTANADYHYEMLGDEVNVQNFRTGDPGFNYYPSVEARYNSGPVSIRVYYEYAFTGKGEVDFNRIGGFDQTLDADPGDGFKVQAGYYYQFAEKWAAGLFGEYATASETSIEGWDDLNDDWVNIEIQPRVIYQLTPTIDFLLGVGYTLEGKNSPFGYPFYVQAVSRF